MLHLVGILFPHIDKPSSQQADCVRRVLRNSKCCISVAVLMKQDCCELLNVFCSAPRCRVVGRDSSVGTATRYGLDGPGIESRWGQDFPHLSGPALGPTQPPIQSVPILSRGWGVKRPGRGVDHPPHLAPRLKKEQSYIPTPPSGPSWPVIE